MLRDLPAQWLSEQFCAEACQWAGAVIGQPLRTTDLALVQAGFWSCVYRISAPAATYYLKAANPGQAFEGPLLRALSSLEPGIFVNPIALDLERDWMLLPDAGTPIREAGRSDEPTWCGVVRQNAQVQQRLASQRAAVSMLPSFRPEDTAAFVRERIDALTALDPSDSQWISDEEGADLLRKLERTDAFDRLAADPMPMTVQHGDLHHRNICVRPDGAITILDGGDGFWTHPFVVASAPLRFATRDSHRDEPDWSAPIVQAIADAYLQPWRDYAPYAELRASVDAADRFWFVLRAATFVRLLSGINQDRAGLAPRMIADELQLAFRGL